MVILLVSLIFPLVAAGPVAIGAQLPQELATNYAYALDLSAQLTLSGAQCLNSNGYSTVFIRAYSPSGSGTFDSNACSNINYAHTAGLGTELYMTPVPKSTKNATQQVDELYNGLKNCNIVARSIWVQITSPVNWNSNPTVNVNFINGINARAAQLGARVGYYTNQYDWNQITGGASGMANGIGLWYWNVNGAGTSGETGANFNDFVPFAYWSSATVKQFGQMENVCGYTVNRDVYTTSAFMAAAPRKESGQPVVGNIGFN
ncbi:unnamed protein product [Cylicocyclus nassatus]|uniref:Lysozyme n=1 Tax=Cylicocyclus nassatus TaxID=53992 RepID=A0AA36HCR1_CYLNA|nr:unnamed protein product [Cylicocyclus nassatus]